MDQNIRIAASNQEGTNVPGLVGLYRTQGRYLPILRAMSFTSKQINSEKKIAMLDVTPTVQ
ncbi:hypothetical protein N7509_000055 [Penicillium cosmopolitanum]|uniref:Uncharacterized protein n=1 Tax=Penicillium cosmopolitanum TaxID=1131564 RepID=A0A9W9WCU9_9EURO|nr:uncharacterized protein N7509_000055 [Penicillium cosmopolitanum]KAJ5414957.1 hypothetical protein N7509_000055 [Penicillium cosmopolitanum]